MKYFVSYFGKTERTFFKSGTAGIGNAVIGIEGKMDADAIRHTEEKIRKMIGADSVAIIGFVPMED